MVGLLDIGQISESVSVRGKDVEVKGISGRGILVLLDKFPEVKELLTTQSGVTAEDLVRITPDAVAAVIAAGCGYPGNKEAEEFADQLTVGEQVELIDAIFRVTFPEGVGPFVEKLTKLVGVEEGEGAFGWDRATNLREQSKSSSPQDTHPKPPGDTPQDKSPDGSS